MTFHRIKEFRNRTMADSPPYLGTKAPVKPPRRTHEPLEDVTHETPNVTINAFGMRIETLDNNALSFANRTYVWREVPKRFQGWKYTQTQGGREAQITVRMKKDGVLYVATASAQAGIDMTGWKKTDLSFHYTDKGRSRMIVFKREMKTDEEAVVPQGNWSGAIVLLP